MSFYSREELGTLGFLSVGENVRVSRMASIYGAHHISIGAHSRIDDFCVLSAGEGGIYIGRNVHIAVFSCLIGKGRIELNDFCNLSSRVSIYSSSDDYSGQSLTNPTVPEKFKKVDHRDVVLKKHVLIGSGTVILPGLSIEEGAAVGALSLVNKDLEAFTVYAGAPVKKIKPRSRRLLELEKLYLEIDSECH